MTKEATWFWKANMEPWLSHEIEEWIPYPDVTSRKIEQAYQDQQVEVIINQKYKIDLNRLLQVDIIECYRQRPIRRCSETGDTLAFYRRERFNFAQPIRRSVTDDTLNYGCSFVTDWLILFTKGKLKIKISRLVAALVSGILIEGEKKQHHAEARRLKNEIESIKKKTISNLQKCCARLYTKPCFLFRLVNKTLRDNDRSKLFTLGPFCYLVFNYIGIRHNEYSSIRNQLKRLVKNEDDNNSEITVYRGETLSMNDIEIYRNAVGNGDFYKWVSFVSTSRSRDVAEKFGVNVLHIITIKRSSSNDQYVDLQPITYCKDEEEILLRPGVRFKIDNAYEDPNTRRYTFHIRIEPSFVSNLL